jgi:hypothetical protein
MASNKDRQLAAPKKKKTEAPLAVPKSAGSDDEWAEF